MCVLVAVLRVLDEKPHPVPQRRTDPAAAKHAGISYLLVPMKQPGVEVRPITQPDGTVLGDTNANKPRKTFRHAPRAMT